MDKNLVFIIIQIVGIVFILAEIAYITFQKPSNLQKILLILGITVFVSFVGYMLELYATNVESAMFGCVIGYIAKPFSLLMTLMFLFEYSNIKFKGQKALLVGLFLFFCFLSTMVFTNEWHHLYYTSVEFNVNRPGSGLVLGHGVFWYMYMATTILIFITYCVLIAMEYKRSVTKQAKQMLVLIFLMLFFGIAGLICFITGLTGGYDATLAGTFLGTICLFILMFKYQLFNSITLAKEKQLIDSEDGLIVIDARYKISFYNSVAKSLFPELQKAESYGFKDQDLIDHLDSLDEKQIFFLDNRIYSYKVNSVIIHKKKKDVLIGKSYIFQDISASYNYSQQLEKDVAAATAKISHMQRYVLASLANLIEARDGCTGNHVKSVSKYCKAIAKELTNDPKYSKTVDDKFILMMEECAPLHDVGKIKVPDSILGKPGKLTPDEREVMKIHTTEGADIIDSVFTGIEEPHYIQMCKNIAKYHHEWFDGSGYPEGIKGEDIPLCARIMAIADVYDALRMERPYKKAFSKEKAIEIMKEERTKHFDPNILDKFLSIVDQLDN